MQKIILENLRSELLSRGSLDTFPNKVWDEVGSLNTYGTNAIEGNTLTQAEVEAVLFDLKGVEKPIQDIIETVQHQKAFKNLINRRGRAIDLVTILELHEEVFHGVMVDAGQWRRTNVLIRGAEFIPPRPEKIVTKMEDLIKEYDQRDLTGKDTFFLGAWMHHGFECIHPFSNGNGRIGRLLLNLHFLKHNWPPINILPDDRDRYLHSLREGNLGDLNPLKEFIMDKMGSSLVYMLSQVGTSDDELKSFAQLQSNSPYSAKYLALRAKQGELPAIMIKHEWRTSTRALNLYVKVIGRRK
jgi:Fic family protein